MHVQYTKVGSIKLLSLGNIIREIHENGQSAKILALEDYPLYGNLLCGCTVLYCRMSQELRVRLAKVAKISADKTKPLVHVCVLLL